MDYNLGGGGGPMKLYTLAEDFPDIFVRACSVVLRIWPIGFKQDNLMRLVALKSLFHS